MLDAHPLAGGLTSMPGIAVRTAARILLEIGDVSAFKSSAHRPHLGKAVRVDLVPPSKGMESGNGQLRASRPAGLLWARWGRNPPDEWGRGCLRRNRPRHPSLRDLHQT